MGVLFFISTTVITTENAKEIAFKNPDNMVKNWHQIILFHGRDLIRLWCLSVLLLFQNFRIRKT
jgi:hypothetical protein